MRNENQLRAIIDSGIHDNFNSSVKELNLINDNATKKAAIEFLMKKFNDDKKLRDEFMGSFKDE